MSGCGKFNFQLTATKIEIVSQLNCATGGDRNIQQQQKKTVLKSPQLTICQIYVCTSCNFY